MAIIGFVVLVLLGLYLLAIMGAVFFGSAMFGGSGAEAILPGLLAGLVLWAAVHFAPFTITFVGG
jgi:hypothetical protein